MKMKVGVNFKYIQTLIIELILIICAIIFFAYHKNQHTNITKNEKIAALINIKDYPKKKLDNYIKEVQSLHNSDDIENTLIVISEKKLKEGYGAKKIIDSPNNQYILVYDSKEKMNRAKLKLSSSVISVEQNIKYSFSDNNSSSSGYNSWGVEKMGLDKIIAKSKTEDFDKVVYLEFEGIQMPVMKGYERYLHLIWGDYMKLPPVEQRIAKHDAVYIDMNNGYKKYKGIYYLVNNNVS